MKSFKTSIFVKIVLLSFVNIAFLSSCFLGSEHRMHRANKRKTNCEIEYIKKNMRPILAAYNKTLKEKPNEAGKMRVRLIINIDGAVTDVTLLDNTMNNENVEKAIIKTMSDWHFPVSCYRNKLLHPDTIDFPFVFQPD
jgi:hypothetical protein